MAFAVPSLLYSEQWEAFLPQNGSVGMLMMMTGRCSKTMTCPGRQKLFYNSECLVPMIAYSSEKVMLRH